MAAWRPSFNGGGPSASASPATALCLSPTTRAAASGRSIVRNSLGNTGQIAICHLSSRRAVLDPNHEISNPHLTIMTKDWQLTRLQIPRFSCFPPDCISYLRRLRSRCDERDCRRGSLLTFPALVFTGVPAVVANASSTVALFPGALASAWGYRKDFTSFQGVSFKAILASAFVGGAVGARAPAFHTGKDVRRHRAMAACLRRRWCSFSDRRSLKARTHLLRVRPLPFLIIHFFLGIYTGYFGGALGLITLAVWSLFGLRDLQGNEPQQDSARRFDEYCRRGLLHARR